MLPEDGHFSTLFHKRHDSRKGMILKKEVIGYKMCVVVFYTTFA
jgi:hypothetical protein